MSELDFPFKVGDRVVFAKRCQAAPWMIVEELDETLFGTRLKVDGKWWSSANVFEHYEKWRERNMPRLVYR